MWNVFWRGRKKEIVQDLENWGWMDDRMPRCVCVCCVVLRLCPVSVSVVCMLFCVLCSVFWCCRLSLAAVSTVSAVAAVALLSLRSSLVRPVNGSNKE
jgi:hypothetical protein